VDIFWNTVYNGVDACVHCVYKKSSHL